MSFHDGLKGAFLPLACALMFACGVASATRSMFGGTLPFGVTVESDANENSAVAVDLLVVYDTKLVDQLLQLTAADWFRKQRTQFLKDHPNQVDLHSWEWVPSQEFRKLSVSYQAGARKIVLFADYGTDGAHRCVVDPQQPFDLVLGSADVTAEPQK